MSLKDRVQMTENGFKIFPDASLQRTLYFGEFSLKMGAEEDAVLSQIEYWEPIKNREIIPSRPKTFVEIAEKEGDIIVERHKFFFAGRGGKNELIISRKRVKKYGKRAYMVTIEWKDCPSEPINSDYIYLTNDKNEKFYFLTEFIEAQEPDSNKLLDKYIYTVPEGEDENSFYVEVDPLVKNKYSVSE